MFAAEQSSPTPRRFVVIPEGKTWVVRDMDQMRDHSIWARKSAATIQARSLNRAKPREQSNG